MHLSLPLFSFTQWKDKCASYSFTTKKLTYSVCQVSLVVKDIYFVVYGIISDFTDKGQFQYLTNLKGPQEGTYLYTTQFLSLR